MPFSSPEMWDFAKKNTKSGNVIKSQKVCVQFLYQHVSWIGEKVTFSEFCTQKIHGQTVQFNLRSCSFSILAPDFAVELLGNCLIYRHFPLIYQILSKSNVYYFCQALGGRINFSPSVVWNTFVEWCLDIKLKDYGRFHRYSVWNLWKKMMKHFLNVLNVRFC